MGFPNSQVFPQRADIPSSRVEDLRFGGFAILFKGPPAVSSWTALTVSALRHASCPASRSTDVTRAQTARAEGMNRWRRLDCGNL